MTVDPALPPLSIRRFRAARLLLAPLVGLLLATVSAPCAKAASLQTVQIRGVPFGIYKGENDLVAVYGNTAIHLDATDDRASISSVLANGGRTYVLIAETCSGNGSFCGPRYRIVDVSGAVPVAAPTVVGMNTSGASWVVADQGYLLGDLKKLDGTGVVLVTYKDGRLRVQERPYGVEALGPAEPPAGDYAAYAMDHPLADAFKLEALQRPLKAVLSPTDYENARRVALTDSGDKFSKLRYSDVVMASMCVPHNCADRNLAVSYTSDGKISLLFHPGDGREILVGDVRAFPNYHPPAASSFVQ